MGANEFKEAEENSEESTKQATETTAEQQEVDVLASKLQSLKVEVEEEEIPVSLKKVARLIQSNKAKKILVLSGAGVSCSAGIPDFRTPGTGLYDNLQKYNLPYPEAVFDLSFYRSNPQPFLSLCKGLWPGVHHSPTLTHSFIALLHKKGVLLRNYSQNIDGLEYLAKLPNDKLVECHGHFRTASCIECGHDESEACQETILNTQDTPLCSKCGGYVKPDIVFFGEDLPREFHTKLPRDVREADLLIIMGTSLLVAPVSLIPNMVYCKRVLLNRERVGNLHEKRGDVLFEGDCDDAVLMLARLLGWEEELLELNESTRIHVNGSVSDAEEETNANEAESDEGDVKDEKEEDRN